MSAKLKLCLKTYELLVFLAPIINKFPKSYRFLLGAQLYQQGFDMLKLLLKANQERGNSRQKIQAQVCISLDLLRFSLRFAKDVKIMSIKQYSQSAKKINEIGRMLQAWKKCA